MVNQRQQIAPERTFKVEEREVPVTDIGGTKDPVAAGVVVEGLEAQEECDH
jgi:hypothetical protein